ncbi:MAG: hypothetical protein FWC39_10015 [Bacteroidetes bacterium]|nr:hypothetical protein [Bacteroidota bacterium]
MKKLKLLLTVFALLALSATSQAQLEVSLIRPNPKTEFGFTIKPSPGFALTYRILFSNSINPNLECRWRWGISFGYAPLMTTMDAFPIFKYSFVDTWQTMSQSENAYFPGEQRFKNNLVHLFYGAFITECKILKTALSPIVGLELRGNSESFQYSTYFPDYFGQYTEDSHFGATVSLFPKAGLVYDIKWWTFQLTAGYNWDFIFGNSKGFPYTAVSLCGIYYF